MQKIMDIRLLQDLIDVAHKTNNYYVTTTTYDKEGKYCRATVVKMFGSWSNALKEAGLYSKEEDIFETTDSEIIRFILIEDLKRVSYVLGCDYFPLSVYQKEGFYSKRMIYKYLGTWDQALYWAN